MSNFKITSYILFSILFVMLGGAPCHAQDSARDPLDWATFVADHFLDQARLDLAYTVSTPYRDAEVIDFESLSYSPTANIAYALSDIYAKADQIEKFDLAFTGEIHVWINDEKVFSAQSSTTELEVGFGERKYTTPHHFTAKLRPGENKLLIQYTAPSAPKSRKLILQSKNLGRYPERGKEIYCSIKKYAPDIKITNWLLLGPFDRPQPTPLPLFTIYHGQQEPFSWTLPKIDIRAGFTKEGKSLEWNYHVGGFMWALRELTKAGEQSRYAKFANKWCDHILDIRPLVSYQTQQLFATRSLHWSLIERPMLDYTSAPALPFLSRLALDSAFENRVHYQDFVDSIMDYVSQKQFRTSNGIFARQYTDDVSVWVDDMFMGLPFMINYAIQLEDKKLKQTIFDDVANQVVTFNELLCDSTSGLFRQGMYPDRPNYRAPHWSRGNGWAIWATTEVLTSLPNDHMHYQKILTLYRRHVEALKRYQNEEGTWHNVLDDKQSEKEASGTAIFTLAIARGIRHNWIDADTFLPVLEKAWTGLLGFVDEKGDLQGVKGGTNFSADPADYARTPMLASDTHGVFPFMFACLEMHYLSKQLKQLRTATMEPPKQLDLYLLMGQSNMAGRGNIDTIFELQRHERVWMFDRQQQWMPAKHPIHFDKPGISGVGLGLQFGIEMALSDPDAVIGLVPCAVGGTALDKWAPGQYDAATKTYPYDDALKRISAAMKYGEVKGMLWHQGEADSNDSLAAQYVGKFLTLVERVRNETGNRTLPVVVGELGKYKQTYQLINRELARLPNIDKQIIVVSSDGLNHKGDGVHFDSWSMNEFGKRYFKAMQALQRTAPKKK